MEKQFQDVKELLLNTSDWQKRVRGIQLLVKLSDAVDESTERDFIRGVQKLENGLVAAIKDLRSQVCKEASVLICCLAEHFGVKLLKLFEVLLQCCIGLFQTTAKVMADAGILAAKAVVKGVEAPKILQIVLSYKSSKAKEIRSNVQSLLLLMIQDWGRDTLQGNMKEIMESVMSGINDADPAAREFGRSNFFALREEFPLEAQSLLEKLDPKRQKGLGSASCDSSTLSIASATTTGFMSKRFGSVADVSIKSARSVQPARASVKGSSTRIGSRWISASSENIAVAASAPILPRKIPESAKSSRILQPTRPHFQAPKYARVSPPRIRAPKEYESVPELVVLDSESDDELLEDSCELRDAMLLMASLDTSEKQRGLQEVLRIIEFYPTMLSEDNCKKVYQQLFTMASEGNHKVMGIVCETLAGFLAVFSSRVEDQMPVLLTTLLRKRSNELLPKSQVSLDVVINAIGKWYSADKRLYTLCGFIGGGHFSRQSAKAKETMVTYAADLLTAIPTGTILHRNDVKSAISTICQVRISDSILHSASIELLKRFHDLHQEEYNHIMVELPLECQEFAKQLQEDKNLLDPSSCPIFIDEADFVPVSASQLLLGDLTVAEPPLLLNSNVSVRDASVVLLEPSTKSAGVHAGLDQLNELLSKCGSGESEKTQLDALVAIPGQLMNFDGPTLDDMFPVLISKVCGSLTDSRKSIRTQALKSLNKLCKEQSARICDLAEEIMGKVMKSAQDQFDGVDISTACSLRECMASLAGSLPTSTVAAIIKEALLGQNDVGKAIILNMATSWVKNLGRETLEDITPEIAPCVVQAYQSDQLGVRKGVIFTLVEIIVKIGQEKLDLNGLGKGILILKKYLEGRQL